MVGILDTGIKQNQMLSLPSLGQARRVHNDGILMLDNHYNMKETELKHKTMENRLKRLEDEQIRAQK